MRAGCYQIPPLSYFPNISTQKYTSKKWVYHNMKFHAYLPAILASLQRRDLRAVCDASFDSGYGSAAWCIDGNGYIAQGMNIVPIVSDTLDATRCELAGIYTTNS